MSTTITIELIAEACLTCGVVFGLSNSHQKQLIQTGSTYWCPNGHGQHYTARKQAEEQIKELQNKLSQEREAAEYWRKSYYGEQEDHDGTKRRLSATKGALTKTKRRVGSGTCPCCSRTFKQLSRHMRDKHPDYRNEGT